MRLVPALGEMVTCRVYYTHTKKGITKGFLQKWLRCVKLKLHASATMYFLGPISHSILLQSMVSRTHVFKLLPNLISS